MRVDFVKKRFQLKWKGWIVDCEPTCATGKLKKRWMCGFSSRLRQNIKKSKKSFTKKQVYWKKNFIKSFCWHFLDNFFSFFWYLYFRKVTQCFRTKKIYKIWNFFENVVFLGAFFGPKPAHFNIQSCSQHISPHFLFLHVLCKKIAQLLTGVFATFFQRSFFRIITKLPTGLYMK
jgi:hypothetical protein